MSVISDPTRISLFRMKTQLSGLKLELSGMTRHGRSMYSIIKEENNLRGSRQKVYDDFKKLIEEKEHELGIS